MRIYSAFYGHPRLREWHYCRLSVVKVAIIYHSLYESHMTATVAGEGFKVMGGIGLLSDVYTSTRSFIELLILTLLIPSLS